ncbi:lipoyltransferase 1, mitochondrial-like isoform X2 [Gigantopelta aegis]|nr:lipoyltransferase 1, mitochondrial-like isoform X2 [Gigantopelta aegis]XP_041361110.1 lipoyltransferase 1, mitochondrial-like isoform X2 [Gigantopelta aegis]
MCMLMTKVFNLTTLSRLTLHHHLKHLQSKSIISFSSKTPGSSSVSSPVEHVVLVSDSTNIFINLALEDWIFDHGDLRAKSYLLMWRNSPAVVIGRHQNPWMECNVSEARRRKVEIVRRRSGGGTVYHDEGNVNFSFIMARPRYNRKANLELVVQAILSRWDVDLTLNKRDDIILNGAYKVSGTAAKLSGDKTYHHFTFLLDVNKENLSHLLQSKLVGVKSKATESVPASVMNVREVTPQMTFEEVVGSVGHSFLQNNLNKESYIEHVDPTEEVFPGLEKNIENLQSWEWIFGNTPKFSIFRHFSNHSNGTVYNLKINMIINKGRIEQITIDLYLGKEQCRTMVTETDSICAKLMGLRYISEEVVSVLCQIEGMGEKTSFSEVNDVLIWILTCIRQCF